MVLDIENIKNLVRDNKIHWRGHMLSKMQQRGIMLNDVLKCILNGDIIEAYPTYYPYPSCLVLGFIDNGRALHVVCAIGEDRIWMITSYYPGEEKWTDSFRKRRG